MSQNICLIGNPNSGKSSLFNLLTGLTQKVSNYPGVTVEKKSAKISINGESYNLIDLPGLYSLYPNSLEEKLVVNIISDPSDFNHPDKVIYVLDLANIERHLLLATQLIDLKFDMVIALNMADKYDDSSKLELLAEQISTSLGVPTIPISSIDNYNIDKLRNTIVEEFSSNKKSFYQPNRNEVTTLSIVNDNLNIDNDYKCKVLLHHKDWIQGITSDERKLLNHIAKDTGFEDVKGQINETFSRFNKIKNILSEVNINEPEQKTLTRRIDKVITHNFWGPIIFLAIMVIVFQAIYAWAEAPMEWIESIFGFSGEFLRNILPANKIADFVVDGILAGLGGVLVFIPQISILFFLLAILEESGYMSRAVYLFDPIMRRFGLNGRSMVALISSGACAIPAIKIGRASCRERVYAPV